MLRKKKQLESTDVNSTNLLLRIQHYDNSTKKKMKQTTKLKRD